MPAAYRSSHSTRTARSHLRPTTRRSQTAVTSSWTNKLQVTSTAQANSNHVVAANLGGDDLLQYELDAKAQSLNSLEIVDRPPGSGSWHSVLSANGDFLYVANEISNAVGVYKINHTDALLQSPAIQKITTLPANFTNTRRCHAAASREVSAAGAGARPRLGVHPVHAGGGRGAGAEEDGRLLRAHRAQVAHAEHRPGDQRQGGRDGGLPREKGHESLAGAACNFSPCCSECNGVCNLFAGWKLMFVVQIMSYSPNMMQSKVRKSAWSLVETLGVPEEKLPAIICSVPQSVGLTSARIKETADTLDELFGEGAGVRALTWNCRIVMYSTDVLCESFKYLISVGFTKERLEVNTRYITRNTTRFLRPRVEFLETKSYDIVEQTAWILLPDSMFIQQFPEYQDFLVKYKAKLKSSST
ncbi:unnamed protein product [Phytophthora lilii]|uniref:Unnamed protein product n=1 Tax=Phytophthora lilii TaxID=2077276 RepID=A0A9W6TYP5_9STRA|nr:unnamed protein product [Phytophthora lilii]